ncbi:Myb/SANT-like domain-containing protein [Dioscorea alata]|uniref:Myb/SANT-like domain-containing protein n=1 Tax=Dioscorea alata TaxID=55571 RepID=A0ACB7W2I0_DIOAL|nr:Myb/SANT-like domain-containing protein [Dioscorea alata]
MDQALIDTLLEVVLLGSRRTENGFKTDECTKVVNKVLEHYQVVVGVAHVRARLKTLKTDYKEITELFKMSGFGLDENGRVIADPLAWEKHLKVNLLSSQLFSHIRV